VHGLLFNFEDGESVGLQNVSELLPDYTAKDSIFGPICAFTKFRTSVHCRICKSIFLSSPAENANV
jgi:hypothetical protein